MVLANLTRRLFAPGPSASANRACADGAIGHGPDHGPDDGQPVAGRRPPGLFAGLGDPLPPSGTEGPLAHAGTGYGLTGLRERAELVSGTLSAGPADGEWQVRLRLPA